MLHIKHLMTKEMQKSNRSTQWKKIIGPRRKLTSSLDTQLSHSDIVQSNKHSKPGTLRIQQSRGLQFTDQDSAKRYHAVMKKATSIIPFWLRKQMIPVILIGRIFMLLIIRRLVFEPAYQYSTSPSLHFVSLVYSSLWILKMITKVVLKAMINCGLKSSLTPFCL